MATLFLSEHMPEFLCTTLGEQHKTDAHFTAQVWNRFYFRTHILRLHLELPHLRGQ